MRQKSVAIILIASALAIAGCTAKDQSQVAPSVVELAAEYPTYDRTTLMMESDIIVVGTVSAHESTVIEPRFEGDTPEENPLLGLSDEERQRALDQATGYAATPVSLQVEKVFSGNVSPGDQITILQTGGVIDGVEYREPENPPLVDGSRYLLFGAESFDGAFYVLGGSAGMFLDEGQSQYRAVNPETAPFETLTYSQLTSLMSS